jgi:hypothetical protein
MYNIAAAVFFFIPLVSLAEISSATELQDRGKQGMSEKTTVTRDKKKIYERLRIDRDRDGKYEAYIEQFYVGGLKVLTFTFVGGSRGVISKSPSGSNIILSSKTDAWKPEGILAELEDGSFESFSSQNDGFYLPIDDAEKARQSRIIDAQKGFLKSVNEGDGKKALESLKRLENTAPPK